MIHTQVQRSPEKNILKSFTKNGPDGHIGNVTWIIYTFSLTIHMEAHLIDQAVLETIFENGGRRRTICKLYVCLDRI